jgi:hypothetical protein
MLTGIFAHAGGEFGIHLGDPPRRLAQAFPVRIFSNAFEDQANPARKSIKIDLARLRSFFDVVPFCAHFGVRQLVATLIEVSEARA